jgi:3-oxoadipate enol-lactonase
MTRQTLLYLPGLDGTGRLLHRQPELHDRYEVICQSYPQLRPADYAGLADAAARAVSSRSGRAIVLAESFGGAVGLTLALRHADLVERLVLVNTFAYYPRRPFIELAALFGAYLPARPSHPLTRPIRGPFFFARDIPQSERDAWWERTADVPLSAYGWRLRLIAGLDLRPRLGEIRLPTLVFVAPDDRIVPACAGRLLARLLPDARLVEDRVAHAALIHPRVRVVNLLDRF